MFTDLVPKVAPPADVDIGGRVVPSPQTVNDPVDEAAEASFPASDAPAWTTSIASVGSADASPVAPPFTRGGAR